MDALIRKKDQRKVEIISEECEECPINRKDEDHRFVGFTRRDSHRLPGLLQARKTVTGPNCRKNGLIWRKKCSSKNAS